MGAGHFFDFTTTNGLMATRYWPKMACCDYIDLSLVDGFTLPFKLDIKGTCLGQGDKPVSKIDCSGLSCHKLFDTKWDNSMALDHHASDPDLAPYCCPTPP